MKFASERNSSSVSAAVALILLAFCLIFTVASTVPVERSLLNNGLGFTPPMGWNSWNFFHCNIDEDLIKQTADAMVKNGFADLGYKYINIDDCWAESNRDDQGNLVPDSKKFPSGMNSLANYLHGQGLKLGIYACAGLRTCSGEMPGSLGYELQDAFTFSFWGVDYLKYDNCFNQDESPILRYGAMSAALKTTGRPIFYNVCEWGDEDPASWAPSIANSWRTTDDIYDSWDWMLSIADLNEVTANVAGHGAWNDPDMLEVGNGGMTFEEYKVHFSLWAISKAPLLIGCDVRNMTSETMSILGNNEVIAVNQDLMGVQAKKVRNFGERAIWAGPLLGGRVVVLFVNRKSNPEPMTALWSDIDLPIFTTVEVRDVWEHKTLGYFQGNVSTTVPALACMMYVLTPTFR